MSAVDQPNGQGVLHGGSRNAADVPRPPRTVSTYLCPGTSQPVTRAVHLARLNAAWPTCDHCEWRSDSEGLAATSLQVTERIRGHRSAGIQRSEFGVRGPYLNEINRQTAADLARIFCLCLIEHSSLMLDSMTEFDARGKSRPALDTNLGSAAQNVAAALLALPPIVVGYDGRSSSPDIFVGVTAAVRELGVPIVDVGRSTAASVQEAARGLPNCAGAMLVTGAGMPDSWTGLDTVDIQGDSVPVVWKDFGVQLQHVSLSSVSETRSVERSHEEPDDAISELLRRARSTTPTPPLEVGRLSTQLRLVLPPVESRTRWTARLARHSGKHEVLNCEDHYREWLLRWYPPRCCERIQISSDDPLIQQRATWLASQTGLDLVVCSAHDLIPIKNCRLAVRIGDDDRQFEFFNSAGAPIHPAELANSINTAVQSRASQLTAHADPASGRFWLTDASRRSGTQPTEHLRDGLAVLGIMLRLMDSGRLDAVSSVR